MRRQSSPGLSPPTRGIRGARARRVSENGSIPAYAGDPAGKGNPLARFAVYPRLRGGSCAASMARTGRTGLSPPTRGIRSYMPSMTPVSRSIPAYAGDPFGGRVRRLAEKVYPRLRGGSSRRRSPSSSPWGLSPPTRGIRGVHAPQVGYERSIPAYAGDPSIVATRMGASRVYPRLRGGSMQGIDRLPPQTGLSPPTRGILNLCCR